MDLGIEGKRAIVCAASLGLGKGYAMALAREGGDVTITARCADELEATTKEIRGESAVTVTLSVGDITKEEGWADALAKYPDPGTLVNNAGGSRSTLGPATHLT